MSGKYVYAVNHIEIGVAITQDGEEEVYEGKKYHDVGSEDEAIQRALEDYEEDDWEVTRIRHIKKVLTDL